MGICMSGTSLQAAEVYSSKDAENFLKEKGIINEETVRASFEVVNGEYAIQSCRQLENNQYESAITMAYYEAGGQLVRADIRPMSDKTNNFQHNGIYITARLSYSNTQGLIMGHHTL